jgi:hypothetical protein
LPQPPQLFLSCFVFTHVPLPASAPASAPHISNPPGHAQLEALQIIPWLHFVPHAPQLAGLLVVLVHTGGIPQFIVLGGQAQTPMLHTAPPVQASPHPPQLFTSVIVSTQAPVQFVVPAGHIVVHIPAQTCGAVHMMVHIPQFWGSVAVLTQTPPQSVPPFGQTQAPLQT